eukprot:403364503
MSNIELTQSQSKLEPIITNLQFDNDSGRHYFLDAEKGAQDHCDKGGKIVRKFDPNLTGKYSYDKRAKLQQDLPPNYGSVELPKSLLPSYKRAYSPQNFLLEGYAQVPSPVSKPYQNRIIDLQRDFIKKRLSMECESDMKTNRENYRNKWNKNLVTNVLENTQFNKNNVGLNHLTSPINYSQNETIKNISSTRKQFLLKNIESYEIKLRPRKFITRPQSPSQEENTDDFNDQIKIKKPNAQQIKLEKLKQNFLQNDPAESINGRQLIQPVFKFQKIKLEPLAKTQTLQSARLAQTFKDSFANQQPNQSQINQNKTSPTNQTSNHLNFTNMNMNTTATSKMMNSIDNSEINQNNLFLNYHVKVDQKRRSMSTMDYQGLKQERIRVLSKSPRNFQNMSPQQLGNFDQSQISLGKEFNTTTPFKSIEKIQGVIPNYNIKQSYQNMIKPFLNDYKPQSLRLSQDFSNAQQNVNLIAEYQNCKEPSQSLKFLDQIQAQQEDARKQELLLGQTKAGGAIMFKFKTDQAILEQLEVKINLIYNTLNRLSKNKMKNQRRKGGFKLVSQTLETCGKQINNGNQNRIFMLQKKSIKETQWI